LRRLDRRRQAGGAGERAGEKAARHFKIDAESPGEGDRDRGAGDDNDDGGQDELKTAPLKGGEKTRTGGDADRKDEKQQPDVLEISRDAIAVMAEDERDKDDRRDIQRNAAHLDVADDDADRDDEKKNKIARLQQGVHHAPLSKWLKI